jgi:pimeloyl-ACP methyl ester carboxylesterase
MKTNRKKKFIIILGIITLALLSLKSYYEIDNFMYQKRMDKMNIRPQIESSTEHKILKMDGYDVHYYVSGKENSDLIVFLHPAFSDHRAFDQQIDYFSKNYRVITIDLIGHGLSKANKSEDKIDSSSKHIEKILAVEGFDKVHLVGVSMGSLIAQHYAINNPDKVQSLTALGGYDINKESEEVEKAQKSSNLSLIFRAIFSMNSFRKKTAEITCSTEHGRASFYQSASHYERKSFMVLQGLQNIIKDRDIKPRYPILILTGEFDIDLAKKKAKEWHIETINSEYFMIEKAGHCANMDQPAKFNELLEQFIVKANNK